MDAEDETPRPVVNGNGAASRPVAAGTLEAESSSEVFRRLSERPTDLLRFTTAVRWTTARAR